MNYRKAIVPLAAASILGLTCLGAANADQQTFASATGNGVGSAGSNVFTFSGGSAGAFRTAATAIFTGGTTDGLYADPGATLTFTGFSATGAATGTGSSADPFREALSGGSFSLVKGSNTLLSGTFGASNVLEAFTTGSTATISDTVNDVTYNSATEYFAESGLQNPGSFSISLTSVHPTPALDGNGYLTAFNAGGTGTFSATLPSETPPPSVPEPATVAPFALGGLGLLGMAFRARKARVSGSTAA